VRGIGTEEGVVRHLKLMTTNTKKGDTTRKGEAHFPMTTYKRDTNLGLGSPFFIDCPK